MERKNYLLHFILISLGILFYFFANFQRIAIPGTVFDLLQQDLNVTAPYITAFGAIYMYLYAFSQLIIGVLVDRFGGIRVIRAGSIILALGMLLFPLSHNLTVMYLSRALVGIGSSTFYLSLIRELREIYSDKNFGLAISVLLCIGYSGGIAANAPFVFAMKYSNWREILLALALVVVVAFIVFSLLSLKFKLPKVNKHVKLRTLPFRLVLHKKHNRNLFSFACCNFGISYVIQTVIGKKFLEDFCLMSSSKAAITLSVMAIIAAIFNIVNASICKICHNKRVVFLKCASIVTFLSLLSICACIFLGLRTHFISLVFFVIGANASLTSILVPVLHITNRKMTSGTAVSIMNFCFFSMVGILGTIVGFLLNIIKPENIDGVMVYSNTSYLIVFLSFLLLSIFEMYKAQKMSNKY